MTVPSFGSCTRLTTALLLFFCPRGQPAPRESRVEFVQPCPVVETDLYAKVYLCWQIQYSECTRDMEVYVVSQSFDLLPRPDSPPFTVDYNVSVTDCVRETDELTTVNVTLGIVVSETVIANISYVHLRVWFGQEGPHNSEKIYFVIPSTTTTAATAATTTTTTCVPPTTGCNSPSTTPYTDTTYSTIDEETTTGAASVCIRPHIHLCLLFIIQCAVLIISAVLM